MEEEPSEIAVAQISRTEYIMKFYDDQISRKRIFLPWNQWEPIVYIGDLIFEIRTRAVCHIIRTRWNSRLNKS